MSRPATRLPGARPRDADCPGQHRRAAADAALIGPDVQGHRSGSDDSVNVNIKKFVNRVTGVVVTTDTPRRP
jgi:hypothetical protein